MNVNDLVDLFGLPRYYAEKLPAGSSLIATVNEDSSITVTIHAAEEPSSVLPVTEQKHNYATPLTAGSFVEKRGPGRPRKNFD